MREYLSWTVFVNTISWLFLNFCEFCFVQGFIINVASEIHAAPQKRPVIRTYLCSTYLNKVTKSFTQEKYMAMCADMH